MPFRDIGQGKRCRTCARLDAERVQATSEEEKKRLAAEKAAHIKLVQDDRAINMRGNSTSELHAQKITGDGFGLLLKMSIDGMDQAKFKVPRNLEGLGDMVSIILYLVTAPGLLSALKPQERSQNTTNNCMCP